MSSKPPVFEDPSKVNALFDQLLTVYHPSTSPIFAKEKNHVRLLVFPTSVQLWKKNKKKRVMAVPIPLCWIVESVHTGKKAKEDESNLFELVEPVQRWRLSAKTEPEKIACVQAIEDALRSNINCLGAIPLEREGVFDFGPSVGIYSGEWFSGLPHGKGRFNAPDGFIFTGDWSSTNSAGYGVIISPEGHPASSSKDAHHSSHSSTSTSSESNFKAAGWETFFPDEPPREAHNDVLDTINDTPGLTSSDVEMLISHSSTRRYSKGDVILHEGEVNDCLYRIKSGIISLTQDVNGQSVPRAEMGPDQMFGEMSVLDKNIISATVVAASDQVELYTIDLDVLYELFKTCPGFSKRFHHAMAETLAFRLLRFFEPKASRGMRTTFSGPLGSSSTDDTSTAQRWISCWNTRAKAAQFYLDLIVYRDPWVTLEGKTELQHHLTNLMDSGRYWTWEEPLITLISEGFRLLCKVQVASRVGTVSRQDAIVEVAFNRKENKFKSISIHFDKDKLLEGQPVGDTRTSQPEHPELGKPQDIKFCHRFNLPLTETVLAEKVCVLASPQLASNVPGTMFVSQQFLCFYSKVFDMKTKEVVPIKAIKSVKKKPLISGILVKYSMKAARKVTKVHPDHPNFEKNAELTFTFPTDYEEIFAEVNALINKSSGSSSSSSSKESSSKDLPEQSPMAMDGYRVATESAIQKFARCSQLPEKLPHLPIRRSLNEQGVRITGPNATETSEGYMQDLCGRTVSTYPRLSRTEGGKVVLETTRQGDPICDQFCVERMENKAIFAVADGCNWGIQPRRAALIASRSFCEFVKHNLSAMSSLQEAGKLFLHAFAAAHHKIVEGFDNKIWECGTTTLIGGAILELAPSQQYVERRWGVLLASIGDCKAFLISSRYKTVVDFTTGSRTGTAAIDASDCGGRLGPYVGEGAPDLRNLSLFYSNADEGDVVILTSDGVYDNLDPQSLGVDPAELGLTGDWDTQNDWAKVEAAKTEYVCEKLRSLIFGPKQPADIDSNSGNVPSDSSQPSVSPAPKSSNLDVQLIVEILINHAIITTQSSRDFMEQFPDKFLPKNYKEYPGKLDHTTCLAIKVKRSTFKSVENELDSLVLRMRNPAQGLSTVVKAGPRTNLPNMPKPSNDQPTTVVLTKGEGIESPRYKEENLKLEAASASSTTNTPNNGANAGSNSNNTSSVGNNSNNQTQSPQDDKSSESSGLISNSPPAEVPASSNSTGRSNKPALRRTNTILNVAIRGAVILRWLKENERFTEERATLVAQHLLSFRYIRPLDLENWRNESFSGDTSYNFQVYEPIMTREDWEQLLRSSKRANFPKDTVIVKEGDIAQQRLFYIISGKCKTIKTTESKKPRDKPMDLGSNPAGPSSGGDFNQSTASNTSTEAPTRVAKLHKKGNIRDKSPVEKENITVNVMCENETFGEISFLFSHKSSTKASASVVADEDVDLYIIEGSWINILFVKSPGMAGRFYHYLASVLAHRLKKQEILESQRSLNPT